MKRAAILGIACGALALLVPVRITSWFTFIALPLGGAIAPFFVLAPQRRARVGRLALFLACMTIALVWLGHLDRALADQWESWLREPFAAIPLFATALISRESRSARRWALGLALPYVVLNIAAAAAFWNIRRMLVPELRNDLTAPAILVSIDAILAMPIAFACWRLRRG